jgi:hypothetical protein
MLIAMCHAHATKKCYNNSSRSIQGRELVYAIMFKETTKYTTSNKCPNDGNLGSSTFATQVSFVPGSKIHHHQVETHHLAS